MDKPVCPISRTSVLYSTDSRGLAGDDLNLCSSNQGVTLKFSIVLSLINFGYVAGFILLPLIGSK
jgi:hypothetical protein